MRVHVRPLRVRCGKAAKRSLPRSAQRLHAAVRAPDRRRPGRRPPVRRCRLLHAGRARIRGPRPVRTDSRSASTNAASTSGASRALSRSATPPTITSSSCARTPSAPSRTGGRVRRAVRGRPRFRPISFRAGAPPRQGCALGRGAGRVLRRLQLLRRPCARPPLAPVAGLARPLVERLPTSTGRRAASTGRRSASSATRSFLDRRAPLRLEVRVHAGRARRSGQSGAAARRIRSTCSRRPTRTPRRVRRARAADGPRSGRLPRRRHARQDRPREHGPLARSKGAAARSRRRGTRARSADADEGSRPVEEAPAEARRRAAAAARDPRGASAASRRRWAPGSAASSSRWRAKPSWADGPRAGSFFEPKQSPGCSTRTSPGRRTTAGRSGPC